MKELQNGRSMIEMLGVLAIIGVLSIGGLAGYTMAMNRHRANTILDYASRCVVVAQTNGDGTTIEKKECKILLDGETYPGGAEKVEIDATSTVDQPIVKVTGITQKVCEALQNRAEGSNIMNVDASCSSSSSSITLKYNQYTTTTSGGSDTESTAG